MEDRCSSCVNKVCERGYVNIIGCSEYEPDKMKLACKLAFKWANERNLADKT